MMTKKQIIKTIRDELMYDSDWLSYAEATQIAYEEWEYINDCLADNHYEDLGDAQ